MINNKDNLGNELTKEQMDYFKDTKIVDSDNNLLVCYHGSPNPGFKEFNPRDKKSQFGRYKFGDHNVNYFTTDEDSANSYGSNRYKVYINIKNPYILKSDNVEDMRTAFGLKDSNLRKKQLKLFDEIFNRWLGAYIDYTDPRFEELNRDLNKINFELRPSDIYSSDAEPEDIELFDLYDLGKNSKFGAEHIVEYEYYTHELFDEDMYDELKNIMVGEDEEDYLFSTDDIVRYVLMLDNHYDGVIIENIFDSASYFGGIGTDIITLESSNQIKSIDNKNPTTSNRIDEEIDYDEFDLDPDELVDLLDLKGLEDTELDEPNETDDDKNSFWYKSMLDTVNLSRKYRVGTTFELDQDDKEYLEKNYPNYTIKTVNLKDVIKRNNLDDPSHGMFGRRTNIWGEYPELYWYSKNKDNERYNPIRLTQDLRIMDGNHRLYALYNMGYAKAEVLVYNSPKLTEALLLEVSRRDLINKSKNGRAYSPKNQALGKNRWERKKWSRVASSTREFNSIDMNAFFKKDVLIVNVPVKGETDDYIVKIKFNGVLKELQKNVQANNNTLDYRTISQSLSRVFNNGDVYENCSCPDFKFRFNHWATVQGFNSGKPENRPNRFDWTNSHDDMGGGCKHCNLVLSNLSWMMKVASVINNYIHYAETFMQRQFADIIFPAVYGVKYPEAVQMGMFDRMYLKHSKGVIDAINDFGKRRGQFKPNPNKKPEFKPNPNQITIFDKEAQVDNQPEEEKPQIEQEPKQNNPTFKQQSIFDYGVEEPEDVETSKPKMSRPRFKNQGYRKRSIFDNDESED